MSWLVGPPKWGKLFVNIIYEGTLPIVSCVVGDGYVGTCGLVCAVICCALHLPSRSEVVYIVNTVHRRHISMIRWLLTIFHRLGLGFTTRLFLKGLLLKANLLPYLVGRLEDLGLLMFLSVHFI